MTKTFLNPTQKARKEQLEKLPSLSKEEANELKVLIEIDKPAQKQTEKKETAKDKDKSEKQHKISSAEINKIAEKVIKILNDMAKKANEESTDSEIPPGCYDFRCVTCGNKIVRMHTIVRDGMISVIAPGAKSIQKDVEDPKFGQRPYCKECNTNVDLSL
jgi:hypothetical protein